MATQTIVIKECPTNAAGQRHCDKIRPIVEERWNGEVKMAVNQVDAGCHQVELVGKFPNHICLADLS